jgi:hypothetical protein
MNSSSDPYARATSSWSPRCPAWGGLPTNFSSSPTTCPTVGSPSTSSIWGVEIASQDGSGALHSPRPSTTAGPRDGQALPLPGGSYLTSTLGFIQLPI